MTVYNLPQTSHSSRELMAERLGGKELYHSLLSQFHFDDTMGVPCYDAHGMPKEVNDHSRIQHVGNGQFLVYNRVTDISSVFETSPDSNRWQGLHMRTWTDLDGRIQSQTLPFTIDVSGGSVHVSRYPETVEVLDPVHVGEQPSVVDRYVHQPLQALTGIVAATLSHLRPRKPAMVTLG